jgi:hypothetical protein
MEVLRRHIPIHTGMIDNAGISIPACGAKESNQPPDAGYAQRRLASISADALDDECA